jgi:gliding motility-associated-like protein
LFRLKIYIVFLVISLFPPVLSAGNHPSLQFIENKGQWEPDILFRAEIRNGYLFITNQGLVYVFYEAGLMDAGHHMLHGDESSNARSGDQGMDKLNTVNMHAVSLEFVDPSNELRVNPDKMSDVYYNYYIGNDTSRWADHVRAFEAIQFNNIYPGIHMEVYSQDAYLKYDIRVESYAKAKDIKFNYRGADRIELANNSIYAETSLNTIIENSPYTYQISGNDTIAVPTQFKLEDDVFSFEFPEDYDHSKPLIIDPLLVFSTYSGSSYDNWGNTATFDNKGNVYSGGTVRQDFVGNKFPVTRGSFQTTFGGGRWDIGILKFDSTGSRLLYGTYLGGAGTETPFSIIANNSNELIVFGITGSDNFPTTDNAYSRVFQGGDSVSNALGTYNDLTQPGGIQYFNGSDLFLIRLSENGRRILASTYLGGSENDGINNAPGFPLSRNYGDEFRGEVNVDVENNTYIAANTSSLDFPTLNGFQMTYGGGTHDGVVAKLTPDLSSIIWSSFIGGDSADAVYGIKIIPDSVAYITGGTMSEDFPVTTGAYDTEFGGDIDGFLVSISHDGSRLVAGTFLGTPEYDQSYFLDTDPEQNVYAFGQTRGIYPVSDAVYGNPGSGQFIHKLSPDLKSSLLSTVVGSGSGKPDISPTAFLVNECGNIFLSGWGGETIHSRSAKYNLGNTFGLPVTSDAFQSTTDGEDFYLMVLDANAEKLLYGTYLGAFIPDPNVAGEHVDGGTSRFDKRGIVYHAICACRDGSQFPTTPGVWSNTNNSIGGCNNGVFKFDLSALRADFTTDSPEFDNPGVTMGCMPFEVVFLNRSFGGEVFEWDFGDGSEKSNQVDSLFHVYPEDGIYTVTLRAFDENTCLKVDVARKNIEVREPNFVMPEDRVICQYDQTQLIAGGAVSFKWSPEYSLSATDIKDPVASPDSTTVYYIEMVDINQCEHFDSVLVTVLPDITSDFIVNKIYDCYSHPRVELLNISVNSNKIEWSFGDGQRSEEDSTIHIYEKPGNYTIKLNSWNDGSCVKEKEEEVQLTDIYVPNIITPNGDNKNDRFEILTDAPVDLIIFNRWGRLIFEENNYTNNWTGNDVPAGTYFYEIQLENDASCKGWLQVLK